MPDLKRWSHGEIARMRHEMDRLFDDLCTDFDLPVMFCRMTGDLDLREDGDALIARFELGNINPDDVSVTVDERRLILSAESVSQVGGRRKSQTFRKELRLPCIIQSDDVEANFKDGVLEVRLPKCPTQRDKKIKIIKK